MRRWQCTYLLDGANGHKVMTVASLDMQQAFHVLKRELEKDGQDIRSLTELAILEVA